MNEPAQMSRIDLLRAGYEAWSHGEVDVVVDAFDTAIEWHGHPLLPDPGPDGGAEDVRRWMHDFLDAWLELHAEPLAFVEAGDSVIAIVRMTGLGRESGVEVRGGADVHIWTWDGDRIVRVEIIQGHSAADRAGLSEPDREAMRLRFAEGLDPAEAAARLGVEEAEIEAATARVLDGLRTIAPA